MIVSIYRSPKHKYGIFRKLAVVIDGKPTITLKVGETKEIEVETDNLVIWVKMDWCRSKKLQLSGCSPKVFLVCGEEKLFWALFATFFYPVNTFSLRQLSHV